MYQRTAVRTKPPITAHHIIGPGVMQRHPAYLAALCRWKEKITNSTAGMSAACQKNSNALIVASMRMTWLPNSQPAFIGRHSPPFSIETLNEVAIQLPDMQLSLSAAGRYTRSVGGY